MNSSKDHLDQDKLTNQEGCMPSSGRFFIAGFLVFMQAQRQTEPIQVADTYTH